MGKVLIVSEDVVKIQTFSGRLGRLYSKIYLVFLAIKLQLIINLWKKSSRLDLLASDYFFNFKNTKTILYSNQLDQVDLARLKPVAWEIVGEIGKAVEATGQKFCWYKRIPLIKLWENKLTAALIYDYLPYGAVLEKLLKSGNYDQVIIVDNSLQSQLALSYADKLGLKLVNCSFFNLNFLSRRLISFFRYRELKRKIKHFLEPAKSLKAEVLIPKNSIVLSADFARHLNTLAAVYKYLHKTGLKPYFIADFAALVRHLSHFNITNPNCCFMGNFLPIKSLPKLSLWAKKAEFISRQTRPVLAKNSNRFNSLIISLFTPEFLPVIDSGFVLSKLYLTAADNFYKTNQPRGTIIVANVRLQELALALLAKQHHRFCLMVSQRTVIFPEEPYRYDEVEAISVTGQDTKEQLVKAGVNHKNIFIEGDPRFENFQPNIKAVFEKLQIKDFSKKLILLISFRSNPLISPEEKKDYINMTYSAVKRLKNAILVIKPHPTEKKYKLMEELNQWQIKNVLVADNNQLDLFNLLSAAAAVVQTWSMTGLEAITLNRPVVIVNPAGKNYDKHIPYISGGGAVEATNENQLFDRLRILIDKNQPQTKEYLLAAKKFGSRYIKTPDGKVCQRIVRHF